VPDRPQALILENVIMRCLTMVIAHFEEAMIYWYGAVLKMLLARNL
jgi:hypothetical protein